MVSLSLKPTSMDTALWFIFEINKENYVSCDLLEYLRLGQSDMNVYFHVLILSSVCDKHFPFAYVFFIGLEISITPFA